MRKPQPLKSRAWNYRRLKYRNLHDVPQQIAIEQAWLAGFRAGKNSAQGKSEK